MRPAKPNQTTILKLLLLQGQNTGMDYSNYLHTLPYFHSLLLLLTADNNDYRTEIYLGDKLDLYTTTKTLRELIVID